MIAFSIVIGKIDPEPFKFIKGDFKDTKTSDCSSLSENPKKMRA